MTKASAPKGTKRQTCGEYGYAFRQKNIRNRKVEGAIHEYHDRLEAILESLIEAGVEPANPDALLSRLTGAEGKLLRFGTASKPRGKNGWLVAFHHHGLPAVVIAGDWGTGAETKWKAKAGVIPDLCERRELKRRMAEARASRDHEQARRWERGAAAAARKWNTSTSANPQHPYLLSKGIHPHKARQQGRELLLLLTDFNGKAWSLQTIDEAGSKRLMAGGKKAGNFIVVDGPDYPARILICEGYATGCTLAEIYRNALVLAAVDCGNLKAVATGARNRWPDADLIVCGDDDRATPGNPGATAARAAALAAGARLALPEWPPEAPKHLSDFNDLHEWLRGQL